MIQDSTFFYRTDSEFISSDFAVNYPDANQQATALNQQTGQPRQAILLPWHTAQNVVSLPQPTFYITTGKRLVDVLISSLVILFILSWLVPIIGLLIVLESSGPFFFVQKRSGRNGKPFWCIKFRTMRHAATQPGGFKQTDRDDNRVTPLGRFLRKSNLDEMPQFLNVLLGDMSLVGPRPHALPHDAMHWDSAAYRERYWVRPGITGLAQVRGSRGATGMTQRMDHRVRYDHLYIPRQTFGLDMKICFRTVKLMVRGDVNAW